ncbi:MAG: RNA polymerase sigma-70 factor [Massilibacteroides sp.]|nr:RNA polymerase sigma-70 factor [Massilibacteroides sp.]MDD3062530.1 RNA polymerase sigma-70 factor [Massilibacteroides sp.]MDD4115362.1 RNA polymerase sigma-70 factor [Massilibacteroides sp.]MDD4659378.1 RNA polymerase sigma-70 factor [Massilibacteroides sp.]
MNCSWENKILIDLQRGNREAFNEFFCFYFPRLLAYTSSIVNHKIAEDITQDVFLYVWENRKRLTISKGFHSYLFQAAYTRCIDYLKKNQSAEKYNSRVMLEHAYIYGNLLNDDGKILEELYAKDFYKQLYSLLEEIPAQRREVFVLAYIHGVKTKEIAEILDIPHRTVESHLYLALKYLKKNMTSKDFLVLCQLFSITPQLLSVLSQAVRI